jgi:hypothetical protein
VSWNAPFKAKIRELYDRWMLNEDRHEWTSGGNPKPPAMDVYLDWICQAWDALSKEAIEKSFKGLAVLITIINI